MKKLIEVGEQQIEKLLKLQESTELEEDKIKISKDINDWVNTVKSCKVVELNKKVIGKLDNLGKFKNPIDELLNL